MREWVWITFLRECAIGHAGRVSARIAVPPALQGRGFGRTDAAAAGLGRGRFNGPDLQRPFQGVRSSGLELDTVVGLCLAYAARMPDSHAFSHSTAAALHGFPLPWLARQKRELHVAAPPRQAVPRLRGVIGHSADTSDAVRVHGLRVLPALAVWCQLGAQLQHNQLVAAGDYLLGGRRPFATPAQLEAAVAQWSPRRGATALRLALRDVRVGVDSPKETELRLLLLSWGLPEPLVNQRYYDDRGRYLGRGDLSWPELRIVFEYEGDRHRTDRETFRRDLARRERFESADWSVIRVTDDALGAERSDFEHTVRARIRRQRRRLGLETAN